MKKYQKGFAPIILLVIVVVAVFAFALYQRQQISITPTATNTNQEEKMSGDTMMEGEMSDWKTYTRDSFTFKYPSMFNVVNSSADNTFYLETENYKPFTTGSYQIQINLLRGSDVMTTDMFIKQIVPNTPDYDALDKQESMMINGYDSVVRTFKNTDANRKTYYVYSPSLAVLFQSNFPSSDQSMFDQIVSTFKFTGE